MNILLSSAGRRVKLVEYFKKEIERTNGVIIAVDCDPTAPALYVAHVAEVVPKIDSEDYIECLLSICQKYQVSAIISLIDPELSLLSRRKSEFDHRGIQLILSEEQVVDTCFDKYQFFDLLHKNHIPVIPTYISRNDVEEKLNKGEVKLPLIVKPRRGSASQGIHIITSNEALQLIETDNEETVIQPFVNGEEYGVDVYIDLKSNELIDMFMKKKIKMRAGETDKSVSVDERELRQLVEHVIEVLKPIGPIDIDCFYTDNGFVVSEVNPRFGGGYPHAYEMDVNFVKYIIRNLADETNQKKYTNYPLGTTMVKYEGVQLLPASVSACN